MLWSEFGQCRRVRTFFIARAADFFSVAAVVLHEHDQRVVILAIFPECVDDAPDALIHVIDHRSIDFHAARFPFLILHFIPITGHRTQFPLPMNQAERFHFFKPRFSDRLIAAIVFSLVFGDVLFQRMHRPVGSGVGDIHEKRLVWIGRLLLINILAGVITQRIGVVIGLGLILRIIETTDELIVPHQRARIKKTACSLQRAIVMFKPALHRPIVIRRIRQRIF